MNTKQLFFFIAFGLQFACNKVSSEKESTFYVRGNCDMCKERIEQGVKTLPGISNAVWNSGTSTLIVSFDSTKVQELALHQAVAATGHGTKLVEMDPKAHAQLPACCQVGGH